MNEDFFTTPSAEQAYTLTPSEIAEVIKPHQFLKYLQLRVKEKFGYGFRENPEAILHVHGDCRSILAEYGVGVEPIGGGKTIEDDDLLKLYQANTSEAAILEFSIILVKLGFRVDLVAEWVDSLDDQVPNTHKAEIIETLNNRAPHLRVVK